MIAHYTKRILRAFIEFNLFGNIRQKNVSEYHFRTNILNNEEYAPIFFLSTGRTGTEFFTRLLQNSRHAALFHSPSSLLCNSKSELIEQGKIFYEAYQNPAYNRQQVILLGAQIFLAARENLMHTTYLHNKVYIETNNRITFLAPAIYSVIPHAKFVHLYRHPGEFVRSGIRRNYYNSTTMHELGRLTPITQSVYYHQWTDFNSIQKITWLWNETNTYIEDFFSTLPENNHFTFNFNHLTVDNINALLTYLDIDDIPQNIIKEAIEKPINAQKEGSYPAYGQWPEKDKESLMKICASLCKKYGYV